MSPKDLTEGSSVSWLLQRRRTERTRYRLRGRFPGSRMCPEVRGQWPCGAESAFNLFHSLLDWGAALRGPSLTWQQRLTDLAPWTDPELCFLACGSESEAQVCLAAALQAGPPSAVTTSGLPNQPLAPKGNWLSCWHTGILKGPPPHVWLMSAVARVLSSPPFCLEGILLNSCVKFDIMNDPLLRRR